MSTSPAPDLDRYFARIGYGGGTAPTFATLSGILGAHTAAIPFENLDVLLGRPVRLELAAIEAKLVGRRRGGYCFEHATLLAAVLERLGFEPRRHAARVVLFAPREAVPRSHMFLTVPAEGETWLLDPGFGPFAPRMPVAIGAASGTSQFGETHALVAEAGCRVLRITTPERTTDAWVSTMEVENAIDFEVANHFISTHPASTFVNRLMMSALTPEGRVGIMNRDLTVRRGVESETRQLADRRELRDVVARVFGFDLPEIEALRVPGVPEWQ